jgi:hypothetical protein
MVRANRSLVFCLLIYYVVFSLISPVSESDEHRHERKYRGYWVIHGTNTCLPTDHSFFRQSRWILDRDIEAQILFETEYQELFVH